MLNYDPREKSEADQEQVLEAAPLGLTAVNIICSESEADVEDWLGVNFLAFVRIVPRRGEYIRLDDGKFCKVTHVFHQVTRVGRTKFISTMPTVIAKLKQPDDGE
jgi:hypothetical protein